MKSRRRMAQILAATIIALVAFNFILIFPGCVGLGTKATAGGNADSSINGMRAELDAKIDKLNAALAQLAQSQSGGKTGPTSQPVSIAGSNNKTDTSTEAQAIQQQGAWNLNVAIAGVAGSAGTLFLILCFMVFNKWKDDSQDARIGKSTELQFSLLFLTMWKLIDATRAVAIVSGGESSSSIQLNESTAPLKP